MVEVRPTNNWTTVPTCLLPNHTMAIQPAFLLEDGSDTMRDITPLHRWKTRVTLSILANRFLRPATIVVTPCPTGPSGRICDVVPADTIIGHLLAPHPSTSPRIVQILSQRPLPHF